MTLKIKICDLNKIEDGGSDGFVVDTDGGRCGIIVIRQGGSCVLLLDSDPLTHIGRTGNTP